MYGSIILYNDYFVTDHSRGFGGKYGVEKDRKDKAALGWDHVEKVEQHQSQKGWLLFH